MAYLGTKPANQVIDSTLIADGTITPADLSTGKPVWDTSGNVGIGTSSPADKLVIAGGNLLFSGSNFVYSYGGGTSAQVRSGIYLDGTNTKMEFYTAQAERMRIDSSGKLLVGRTSAINTSRMSVQALSSTIAIETTTAADGYYPLFFYNAAGSYVGYVYSNSSSTSYVTSSDYRLKENIAPMTGALNKVAQLKPCTYTWKSTGEESQGFIAHELQTVVPDAVVGEKDAVNEDGSIKPQGIDTSFLVATLTAAIQELKAELDTVKAELATLKGTA